MRKVAFAEPFYLVSHAFSLVSTGSDALGLDERMYLAVLEGTILVDSDFYNRSIA